MQDVVNFDYTFDDTGNFNLQFNPVSRPVLEWNQEVSETTKKIANLTDKPIYLCMSGGIDSEIIAREFLKNKIPFKALTLRHIKGTNDHDINYAVDFCKSAGVELEVYPFDFEDFVINKIPQYISQGYKSWRTFRFQQLFLFDLIESKGGTAVLGGGQSPFFTENRVINWNWKSDELICLDWLKKNDKLHFPYFYWQNPEIFAAYFNQGLISYLLTDPDYFLNHHAYSNVSVEKMLVCHKYWPDMVRRRKYDGFEMLPGTPIVDHITRRRKVMGELTEKSIPVSEIKKQLRI
jgi:hypothetical protein